MIAAGTTRNFYFYFATGSLTWATQGGTPFPATTAAAIACPGTVAPNGGTPSAAVVTITVVGPSQAGNWVVWGGGAPEPNVSALNWSAGATLANTTVIPGGGRSGTGPGGGILDFAVKYNGPTGTADFIADVVGYYVENQATALQCNTLSSFGTGSANVPNSSTYSVNFPACGTGYTLTGLGCGYQGTLPTASALQESSEQFGYCLWGINGAIGNLNGSDFVAESRCCRVPGI